MTQERWAQIEKLFHRALQCEPDKRPGMLEEVGNTDPELRREVELLLCSHKDARAHLRGVVGSNESSVGESHEAALGPFIIIEKIGEGGMGVVYRARDTRLGRIVAVKLLPDSNLGDADQLQRLGREAKAASALNHTNIVTIHDICEFNGQSFIVMEYVDGPPLRELIPKRGMKLSEGLHVAVQIADALAAAHAAGIVHRDLKPSNIMVDAQGCVKVLDFGLAKWMSADVSESTKTVTLTEEGVILGSVSYMSPEQAEGRPVDGRSDIFSFGAVLYEMITGTRAFTGESQAATLAAVLTREPKSPSEISQSTPPELERLILRCLKKDMNKRSQHMSDVKLALEELCDELESGKLIRPLSAASHTHTYQWQFIWVAIAVCLVLLVGYLALARHWIWEEHAVLLLTTNSVHLVEGSDLQLRITIVSKAPLAVSEGVVQLSYDPKLLKLRSGSDVLKTPAVSSTLLLPTEGTIDFLVLAAGTTKINAVLQTRYRAYSSDATVEISPADITEQASLYNFTGRWHLQIGTARGLMEIRQQGHIKISGAYFLDNGDTGVIDASRDGKNFWGSFTRGNTTTRWYADYVPFKLTEGYIELKGDAYLEQATEGSWLRNRPKQSLYATVPIR